MSGENQTQEFVWCVVANIKREIPFGPEKEIRLGTKHFSPGAKVYCFKSEWDPGLGRLRVIGRHRGSRRFVKMVIEKSWLTNWRVKAVYNPRLVAKLKKHWSGSQTSKDYAEEIVHCMSGKPSPVAPTPKERTGCLSAIFLSFLGF